MVKSSVLKFLFIAGVSATMQAMWPKAINPTFLNSLSPNIHMQILQTDLYTFPLRIS